MFNEDKSFRSTAGNKANNKSAGKFARLKPSNTMINEDKIEIESLRSKIQALEAQLSIDRDYKSQIEQLQR